MPSRSPSLLACSLLSFTAACGGGTDGAAEDAGPAAGAAPESSTPAGGEAAAPRVPSFHVQDGWVEEAPTGSMRVVQYRLPQQGDDGEAASLVVYHFPSIGSVEDNFRRWAGQIRQPDGSSSWDTCVQSERRVDGLAVHQLDCSGHYVAEMPPGSGNRVDKPGFRLLGAVVESSEGPYYVKLTGPEATVAHWKSSYENFLSRM